MKKLTKIIAFTGPPGFGKTSLSKFAASEFGLPCVNKDSIKKILFDNFEIEESLQSRQFGSASVDLLFYFAEMLLVARSSFILESNFEYALSKPHFDSLWKKGNYEVLQVLCKTDFDVLFDRFDLRSRSSQRHPKHKDKGFTKETFQDYLKNRRHKLSLMNCRMIEIDTTDDFDVARSLLKESIGEFLGEQNLTSRST